MDPKELTQRIESEQVQMQLDTLAVAMLVLNAQIRKIAEDSGIVVENPPMTDQEKANHKKLIQSIARRIVKVALLNADLAGEEVDKEKIAGNVLGMLERAKETKGASIQDDDELARQIYDGAVSDDEKVSEENKDYALDEEPVPMSKVVGPAPTKFNDLMEEENQEEEDGSIDEDLLAMFRSSRKQKVEDTYVEFEDNTIRANFYNPETLPNSPEEFMQYEEQATLYFKTITEKAHKAGLLDKKTTAQVITVLHGGVNFQEEVVMTEDRGIMEGITDQGHTQPYFEAEVTNPTETAEAIITAYSVSIARLRGAYMQAKLEELQDYAANRS